MVKVLKILQSKTLRMVGCLALVLGATAASTATMFLMHQPECPKELIK